MNGTECDGIFFILSPGFYAMISVEMFIQPFKNQLVRNDQTNRIDASSDLLLFWDFSDLFETWSCWNDQTTNNFRDF